MSAAANAADVVVIATARVQVGSEQAFIERANRLVDDTRREVGVVSYTYHHSVDTPSEFVFVEHYATQKAFEAHLHGPVLADFFGKAKPLFAPGFPVIKQYREVTP
jgi:quinol monooxygenase YgiN